MILNKFWRLENSVSLLYQFSAHLSICMTSTNTLSTVFKDFPFSADVGKNNLRKFQWILIFQEKNIGQTSDLFH